MAQRISRDEQGRQRRATRGRGGRNCATTTFSSSRTTTSASSFHGQARRNGGALRLRRGPPGPRMSRQRIRRAPAGQQHRQRQAHRRGCVASSQFLSVSFRSRPRALRRRAGLIEEADKVGAAGWTKTHHTQRLIPIERIAPETDLEQLARKVVDEQLPKARRLGSSRTRFASFRVHHEEHSPAMHLHKADVEKMVADMVPEDSYRVDLERPDRVILVVVAGGSAMMSVVADGNRTRSTTTFTSTPPRT